MADSEDIRTWNSRWAAASQAEQLWRTDGRHIVRRYRDDGSKTRRTARFNILWSNNEILLPALYLKTPEPNIRRRYRDKDPVAKAVAEVLERSLSFILDDQDPDFDTIMYNVLQDYTLPGRGTCRVRYEPEFGEEREDLSFIEIEGVEEGEEVTLTVVDQNNTVVEEYEEDDAGRPYRMNEVLVDERVVFEYINWEDMRFGKFQTWPPPWVGFEGGMTKNEIEEAFPELSSEKIKLIPFDRVQNEEEERRTSQRNNMSAPAQATIREIWDRDGQECLIYAPFMEAGADEDATILKRGPPPLDLKKFFDMPEPLYAVKTTDTGIPVPEYRMYQDQAQSLDRVTNRIDELVDAMKVRGVYDKQFKELANLFRQGNRKLVPVDNYQNLMQSGGLNGGALQMVDISVFASAIGALYVERDQLKNIIFEVIGLADIMRGVSNPEEALGTQRLKANFGSNRLDRRRKAVQRFIRDMLRIASEIICEVFELETIQKMTGLDYPTNQEKQQAQQMIQQAQQAQQVMQQMQQAAQNPQAQQAMQSPEAQQAAQVAQQTMQQITPEMLEAAQKAVEKPTWEEIQELMQNEATRKFRVDIETDSTLALDDQREKQVMAEMLAALSQILQVLGQAEMQGVLTRDQTNAFLLSVIRKMDGGRAVEDIFDQNDETNQESLIIQQMRQQMQQMGQQLEDKSRELDIKAQDVQQKGVKIANDKETKNIQTMLTATTQESVAEIRSAAAETVAQINSAAKEATANTRQTTDLISQLTDIEHDNETRRADQTQRFQAQAFEALAEAIKASNAPKKVTKTDDGFDVVGG